ncbi:hypothetical protein HCU64_14220 [Methylobacterium sp. C25]|uniref:hypothetical protein n=1 Tax=Methylobacterium sp. C25 TaxID=2721622 RepID=UPI001F15E45E|nr:hypothetical protein [Methylobacterium sp. C25]MCE4224915.1 hypothetical protein [Methylobacterium sp. C25]
MKRAAIQGQQLAAAVRFDPQRRAASPEMRAAVASVITGVEEHEAAVTPRERARSPQRQANFHAAIEALVCNLAGLALDPFDRPLAVPRSNGVMWSGTRYAEPVYGQHFLDALDLMADPPLGLIEELRRGFSFEAMGKQPSTIRPGLALSSYVAMQAVSWADFKSIPAAEVIVLKAMKGPDDDTAEAISYDDSRWPDTWRKEVQEINNWLADAPFWLLPDGREVERLAGVEPVNPTRRALRRVFNGAHRDRPGERWGRGGGRLFDGFWINMPKAERYRRLRIASAAHPEGEEVAAVDMRQFNPRAAYDLALLPVPDGDLYDVRGDGSCRSGFKKLVNAMLSANKRSLQWPDGLQSEFPAGTKLRDVVDEVERFHAPIADKFWTGVGTRLAMIESTIVIDAIRLLIRQGVVALPVHDAIWCARSEAGRVTLSISAAADQHWPDLRAQTEVELPQANQLLRLI